jgi:hypothetical protein
MGATSNRGNGLSLVRTMLAIASFPRGFHPRIR